MEYEYMLHYIACSLVVKIYRDIYFGYSPGIVAASNVSRD